MEELSTTQEAAPTAGVEDSNLIKKEADDAGAEKAAVVDQTICSLCSIERCSEVNTCQCDQLEAEPLENNTKLWAFDVRSRNIDWKHYVDPLNEGVRTASVYLDQSFQYVSENRQHPTSQNRREVLVCHDMMGNYLADKHFHSCKKYDDYRFMHWSGVDYFNYFSHSYITIPPCGWLNAAHRHGVPVLGTFIVEGADGSRQLTEVLANEQSVTRTVNALTKLCLHFSFEGWLINVECPVNAAHMNMLYKFLNDLRLTIQEQVPHGRVFWYDSVIASGELNWQNEINSRNVDFYKKSDGMLINYNWTDKHLAVTERTVRLEGDPLTKTFMGLDVFGRGQEGRFLSQRTVSRIAAAGFSTGIFAPAWSYETLRNYGYNIHTGNGNESVNSAFLSRNDKWWARIWPWLGTHPYCKLPFYTNFCTGSGRATYQFGACISDESFFNLSRQSLQPSVPFDDNAEHSFSTVYAGGSSLHLKNYTHAFRLFISEFQLLEGRLLLSYAYKMDKDENEQSFEILLRCCPPEQQETKHIYIFCGQYGNFIQLNEMFYISPTDKVPEYLLHNELPQGGNTLANGWAVRYYLIRFDGPVVIRDIGVKSQAVSGNRISAYLGAVHIRSLHSKDVEKTPVNSFAHINVNRQRLWGLVEK